jgi:hypothetical protein
VANANHGDAALMSQDRAPASSAAASTRNNNNAFTYFQFLGVSVYVCFSSIYIMFVCMFYVCIVCMCVYMCVKVC